MVQVCTSRQQVLMIDIFKVAGSGTPPQVFSDFGFNLKFLSLEQRVLKISI